jgi:GNAT superfamily N-acetyltransferase
MLRIVRTDSEDEDFRALVKELDAWLAYIDGADNAFYATLNKIDKIRNAVVAYIDEKPVGCGAVREFTPEAMEVKRMFTLPEHRKKGIAKAILTELEVWTKELGYKKCVLETGKRQPEAIDLYVKQGYQSTPNYGQYVGVENSVCFEKRLR